MPRISHRKEAAIRNRAYFIWEREGRPEGRADEHWYRAIREMLRAAPGADAAPMLEEEKILAGHSDVNMPALLTKDVPGG